MPSVAFTDASISEYKVQKVKPYITYICYIIYYLYMCIMLYIIYYIWKCISFYPVGVFFENFCTLNLHLFCTVSHTSIKKK